MTEGGGLLENRVHSGQDGCEAPDVRHPSPEDKEAVGYPAFAGEVGGGDAHWAMSAYREGMGPC